jgi:hypothetical protein
MVYSPNIHLATKSPLPPAYYFSAKKIWLIDFPVFKTWKVFLPSKIENFLKFFILTSIPFKIKVAGDENGPPAFAARPAASAFGPPPLAFGPAASAVVPPAFAFRPPAFAFGTVAFAARPPACAFGTAALAGGLAA